MGIRRPEGRLSDPNFFPGGSGYIQAEDWSDLQTSDQAIPLANDITRRDFLVVGHFQANIHAYAEERRSPGSQFRRTWTRLASLLEGSNPSDFFLTNARLGLPVGDSTTGFPISAEHDRRCALVLAELISILQPRVIICLGPHAARILAAGQSDLEAWEDWPGFSALDERGQRELHLGNGDTTAVVVRHPSAIPTTEEWEDDKQLVNRLLRADQLVGASAR